ncbi:alcohol dehydrogenase [Streptomyces armeniacus]|uniref:2-deoxy-scyllo-inosamine dehydrogenase n=2 Tax=Streptomyces armeniacus TaxID=83291 RepID=A0A345XZT2_9ACTN|nr:alcohol dehydrogenase [Streptomyces armeniacus]
MWAKALTAPATFGSVEVPRPGAGQLGPGQVLLKVLAGGICGSDVPFFLGTPGRWEPAGNARSAIGRPGFPMHEVAGTVVATTDPAFEPGQHVVGWATAFDGMAEYVVTDSASLSGYDAPVAPEQAVLLQPLACVLYAVERTGDVTDDVCAVLGLGPIGLLFAHVLKNRGARRVIGVDRVDRSDTARDFGIDAPHWAATGTWAAGLAADARPDVVVEAIGHQASTLNHAVHAAASAGRVFYFGVPDDPVQTIDMDAMLRKNLTLMAGGTSDRRRMLAEADAYLRAHPELFALTVTHTFGADEVQRAYDLAVTPAPGRLKVVVSLEPGP